METLEEAKLCFPQLNSSCRKTMRPYSESMVTYIILSSISVLTVTLNLLVIISISHFKQLHTPTNFILLSLAVSDFFVGLLMAFQVVLIDGCWFLGDLMCVVYNVLDYIITSSSVGTMVLISVDRYVAICHPLHYSTEVTQKRVQVCICLCWMCSAIFHSLMLKDNLKQPGRYNSCIGEDESSQDSWCQDTILNASTAAFVICLFYFNSCLNPVIYAFFYSWFRESVKLIVTLKILQADSCETNML
ncbi:trace amine-associated receptor 8a-like [Morone saxatilis]|uniref:trace amine-associated receptor 8a-like n=1 Tax=Morone saxatilis TaxID=34816 RepID=UPI0015E1D919|nr:trace amine-associated receptor 8a-like [Morone saxatilis]